MSTTTPLADQLAHRRRRRLAIVAAAAEIRLARDSIRKRIDGLFRDRLEALEELAVADAGGRESVPPQVETIAKNLRADLAAALRPALEESRLQLSRIDPRSIERLAAQKEIEAVRRGSMPAVLVTHSDDDLRALGVAVMKAWLDAGRPDDLKERLAAALRPLFENGVALRTQAIAKLRPRAPVPSSKSSKSQPRRRKR